MKQAVLILAFALGFASSQAQVTFIAKTKKVVALDERFRLTFELNARGNKFTQPQINDFQYSGPSTSSSSSVQFINGKMSQSVTYSYSYVLQPKSVGKFTIGAASVEVDGKVYQSDPVVIEVVKGRTNNQAAAQGAAPKGTPQQTNPGNISPKDLFVKYHVSKSSLVQGEHLVATLKLYSKVNLAGFNDTKFPTYNGFWSQAIDVPSQIQMERENVNGEVYEVGVIKRDILFPQRSGTLTIDPAELACVIRMRVRRASFFDAGYRDLEYTIKSKPIAINVQPFPAGKPASFGGAVGSFEVKGTIDKTDVKVNDAITYKLTVTGNGNLKLIEAPNLKFPAVFEVFDPKVTNSLTNSQQGVSGSKTFEYIVFPRSAGEFEIPSVEFSFFNTRSRTYKTLRTEAYKVQIEKDESGQNGTVVSSFRKDDVAIIGNDIRFIKTVTSLKAKNSYLFGSTPFYLTYLGASFAFVLLLFFRNKQASDLKNVDLVKNKQANKVSKKRLRQAAEYLKQEQKEAFYEEISKALWGYLGDKLAIPVSELSKDNVTEALEKHQVHAQTISGFTSVLNTCEFARYAPTAHSGQLDDVYSQASSLISDMEQQLR